MTDLLSRPLLRRPEPEAGARPPWPAAVAAAGWSLLAGLGLMGLPVLLVWLAAGAAEPVPAPLRLAGQVWLGAHRVGIEVDGAWWQLAPWGLTLLPLLLLHRAGRWAAHGTGVRRPREAARLAGVVAAVYGTGAALVAVLVGLGPAATVPAEAALTAALLAALGAGAGVAHEAGLLPALWRRVPALVQPALVAALAAVCVLLATGGLLVAGSALAHADRIGAVGAALDPGLLGGAVLALVGAALAPNLALWASSYALGPGFALGAGTSVAPGGVELGLVPALPALGALPATAGSGWGWLALAGPLGAGAVAGVLLHRRAPYGPWWQAPAHALAAGAVAALAMAVLAGLSGGSVGGGRLAQIGPDPGAVALATLVEVGVAAAVVVAGLRFRQSRTGG